MDRKNKKSLENRIFHCKQENCDFKTNNAGTMCSHKRNIHNINVTWYKCDQENCDYKSKIPKNLKNHKSNIHNINVTWYKCDQENCDYKCKEKRALKSHKMFKHDIGVIWYNCDQENCNYKCKLEKYMKHHKSVIHDIDIIWYKCDEENCNYKCKDKRVMKCHKSYTHNIDVKWYFCEYSNCGHKSKDMSNIKTHFKLMHTKEGQARQKKEEQKIAKLLDKNGIQYDREQTINFNCFQSGRSHCFIDFVLYRKDSIILLEIDENQHKYGKYTISCDMKRMNHVISAIRCEGKQQTILFLRYNPHNFKINKVLQKVTQKDRKKELIEFINNYEPKREGLEIKYMYYDKENNENVTPLVANDTDYNLELRKCII